MNKHKYALLIRVSLYKTGRDLSELTDDEVIYFYENTVWGTVHSIGMAACSVAYPVLDYIKKMIESFKKEEGVQ